MAFSTRFSPCFPILDVVRPRPDGLRSDALCDSFLIVISSRFLLIACHAASRCYRSSPICLDLSRLWRAFVLRLPHSI